MNLSDKEKKEIRNRVDYALSHFDSQDTKTEDILKSIYVKYMPIESEEQGIIMAKHIVDVINGMEKVYDAVSSNEEISCEQKLKELLDDIAPGQRAKILLSASKAFENIKETVNGKTYDNILSELQPDEEYDDDISEEKLDELIRRTASAVTDESTLDCLLDKFRNSRDKKRIKVECKQDARVLMAIQSMVIYTMVKTGKLSGLPGETSLFEIVAGVYTEHFISKQAALLNEKEKKLLRKKVTFWLITIIAVVAIFAALSFLTGVAFIIIVCGSVLSAMVVGIVYLVFHDCLDVDVLEIPKIRFSEFMSKTTHKLSAIAESVKQKYEQKQKENAYTTVYDRPLFAVDEDKLDEYLFNSDVLIY